MTVMVPGHPRGIVDIPGGDSGGRRGPRLRLLRRGHRAELPRRHAALVGTLVRRVPLLR